MIYRDEQLVIFESMFHSNLDEFVIVKAAAVKEMLDTVETRTVKKTNEIYCRVLHKFYNALHMFFMLLEHAIICDTDENGKQMDKVQVRLLYRFRDYFVRFGVVPSVMRQTYSFGQVDLTILYTVTDLLEWDGWTEEQKEFFATQGKRVDIMLIFFDLCNQLTHYCRWVKGY